MERIRRIYDMLEFYAARLDFSNNYELNDMQYKSLTNEIRREFGVKMNSRVGYVNSDIHACRTEISKILYLIHNVSDNVLQEELTAIVENEKIRRQKKLFILTSIWGYMY